MRYITAVDTSGVLVSKAAQLFLCNDLLPPNYHYNMKNDGAYKNIALKVTENSLNRAMIAETNIDGGLSVRGDFGWHNRAQNNSQTGLYLLKLGNKTFNLYFTI